jgi:MoxR-like ATPase
MLPMMNRSNTMRGELYTYSADEVGATMSYADGEVDRIIWADLSEEIKLKLLAHGTKQKITDASAKSRDPKTGRSVSAEDKIGYMRAVVEQLREGLWARSGGGGSGSSEKLLLIRALAQFAGKSLEAARDYIDGKSKTEQAALAANPKIRVIIDKMREQTLVGVDSDELLDGFMGD